MAGADLAHVCGGAMLVLALLMLAQRRVGGAIGLYALQSAALALAAAAQGWAQGRLGLWAIAGIVLALQGVAMTGALRRFARSAVAARGGSPAAMAWGVGVVVLAILAVRGAALPAGMAREDLAAALSVLLVGLLMVVTRRDVAGQVLGFLSAASGVTLAAVSLPGLPLLVIVLGLGLLAISLAGLMGSKGPRPLAGPGQRPGLPPS